MTLVEIVGLLILGFALGAQLRLRSLLVSRHRAMVIGAAVALFAALSLAALNLYDGWRADPIGMFLLPPNRDIWYFAAYAGRRIFGPFLVSALAGVVAYFAARALNKRFDERFFEDEEPFLFGFTVFVVGYPQFLFYISSIFCAGLLLTLAYAATKKGRAPLYALWLPLGIFAILITQYLFPGRIVGKFNF